MSTDDSRPQGGPFPESRGAGRFTFGDRVRCPGTDNGRRHRNRGDGSARPCRYEWGRVGPGTVVEVSVKQGAYLQAHIAPEGQTLLLECPWCHCRIEFKTRPSQAAA